MKKKPPYSIMTRHQSLLRVVQQGLEARGQVLIRDERPHSPYIIADRQTNAFVRRVYPLELLALARELGCVPGQETEA